MAYRPRSFNLNPARPASGPRLSIVFALLSFFLVFASGYMFGQADAVQGRHVLSPLLRQVGIDPGRVGIFAIAPASVNLSDDDRKHLQAFWETWNYVDREFFPREAVNHQAMAFGAIRGMLDTLKDQNTVFLTPANRELADSDLRGSFDGVGIQVDSKEGQIRVTAPIDGSPAQQAGILAGDVLTHVDDLDVRSYALNDTVPLIRGPRGTSVTLTIQREGVPDPIKFPLVRSEIRVKSVRTQMLDGNVGYVRISTFSRTAPAELSAGLQDMMSQNPAGLVLDLRSNPGGFVTSAIEISSQFMSDGVIFYQRGASSEDQEFRSKDGGLATSVPMVVLINRGSASASEITAAALRDAGRAVLMGETTYGKGTVQTVRQLSDQSGLRITSAQWLTPGKIPIHGQGLQPDIALEGPLNPGADLDRAITDAAQYLLSQAATDVRVSSAP